MARNNQNKNNRNGNTRSGKQGSNRKGRGRGKETEVNVSDKSINMQDILTSSPNDWSWYAKIPRLMEDAASHSYLTALGTRYPKDYMPSTSYPKVQNITSNAAPGVMAYYYSPVIGSQYDFYSPINIAARNAYSDLRRGLSGYASYDSPDLMMYYYAIGQAYGIYQFMARIYGTINLYSSVNHYLPDTLLRAQGLKDDDYRKKAANFRQFINIFATELATFNIPKGMAFIERLIWMNAGYYKDSDTGKSQIYMYVPDMYYLFEEVTEGPGKLVATKIPDEFTLDELMELASQILKPLIASESISDMSGDILKVYGDNNLMKVFTISEDYLVLPEFNLEVLSQFQNATIFNGNTVVSDITQTIELPNPNMLEQSILYTPINWQSSTDFQLAYSQYTTSRLITMYKSDVTPADTMVATRLSVVCEMAEQQKGLVPKYYGTEIVTRATIYGLFYNDTVDNKVVTDFHDFASLQVVGENNQGITSQRAFVALRDLEAFDYHPAITYVLMTSSSAGSTLTNIGPFVDFNEYTFMSPDDIRQLHEAAILSEFVLADSMLAKK